MSRSVNLIVSAAIAAFAGLSSPFLTQAEEGKPYAQWVETESLAQETRSIFLEFRRIPIPSEEEVPIPRYPNSRILTFTPIPGSEGIANAFLLVSKDPLSSVDRWYTDHLPGYSRFDVNVDGSRRIYFLRGRTSFNVEKDNIYSEPYVNLIENSKVRRFVPAYVTVIELADHNDQPLSIIGLLDKPSDSIHRH